MNRHENSQFNQEITEAEKDELDISNPDVQRVRLHEQDPELLKPILDFATKVASCPADPKYPDIKPQAVMVGGFVRDALLGGHPKDADMEVLGLSPGRLEELLDQLFPDKVNKVGKQFGIFKIRVNDRVEFDVSIPRSDSKTGTGHTGFVVNSDPSMSIQEAARRRDFTWNALAADMLTGEVYDPFGGIQDLKDKKLRVTDPERFQDDPLRVMRAVQFAARMELTIEPESFDLMSEMVARGDLNELPPERITSEMEKLLLKAERPSIGFEAARELGIIERHFSELHDLIGVEQEKEWHPEGDVWIHSMMVVDAAAKIIRQPEREFTEQEKIQVMLGSLLHDLGKASTTKLQDGRWRALGHAEAGKEPAKELCKRLSFGQDITKAVVDIAEFHLQPAELYKAYEKHLKDIKGGMDEKSYTNAVRRLIGKLGKTSWKVLLAAAESDSRGRTVPGCDVDPYLPGEKMAQLVDEHKLDTEGKKKLIGGDEVVLIAKELGLEVKPGPEFGRYINTVEHLRDLQEVSTKEEAIEKLREIMRTEFKKT